MRETKGRDKTPSGPIAFETDFLTEYTKAKHIEEKEPDLIFARLA